MLTKFQYILLCYPMTPLRVTITLTVVADGMKQPPYVILKGKIVPQEQLPATLIISSQYNGWKTNKLIRDWLQVVWNRRQGRCRKKAERS
jgi:hypothetical protein